MRQLCEVIPATQVAKPEERRNMKVGVPKEILANERRVALTPDAVTKLVHAGMEVLVESGAGDAAFFHIGN